MKNLVGREKPGTPSTLTIIRDKKTITLNVKVAERTSKSFAALKEDTEAETSNELGIEVEPVPSALASKLGIKEGQGLRVKDLKGDGAGRKIGLREGDVILEIDGTPVNNASDFADAVAKAKSKKDAIIQFEGAKRPGEAVSGRTFDLDPLPSAGGGESRDGRAVVPPPFSTPSLWPNLCDNPSVA